MGTRATFTFADEHDQPTVFQHWDGDPPSGLENIKKAQTLAWGLPRFEANEFSAAFVAANKDRAGGFRLTESHDSFGDTEYHYTVTCRDGVLWVLIHHVYDDQDEEGTLEELLEKYA